MKKELCKPYWEQIDRSGRTWRLPVYGGWIVETRWFSDNSAAVFVPDPEHNWLLPHQMDESDE